MKKALKSKINNISQPSTEWLEAAAYRQKNESWLDNSAKIAIKILRALKNNNMSKAELALKLGVSAQYVTKIVKGHENLTLETIDKLEKALGIRLMYIDGFYSVVEIQRYSLNEERKTLEGERVKKIITKKVSINDDCVMIKFEPQRASLY